MITPCKICGNEKDNRLHVAREMMFGYRDQFDYLECGSCGCVHIVEVPANLAKYYPPNYYSFGEHGRFKTFLRHQWSAYALNGWNPIGWLVWHLLWRHDAMVSIRRAGIAKSTRILDVGCGSGHLILDLHHLGFRSVAGLDPYLAHDLEYANGVKVYKRELAAMTGEFDLIMLHHAFEHMDQPAEVMRQLARLLAGGGRVIIRIPIADSYAWRHYGVNWMHMDPPRHLFLHTRRSMELLCHHAGLTLEELICEGNESQFIGSEQIRNDVPLIAPESLAASPLRQWLHWGQMRRYRAQAQELNRKEAGDWACFYLRKTAAG